MKLGIILIILGALAWCWFLSSIPHPLSTTQWIASVFLLGMFVGPGVQTIVGPN